MDQIFYYVLAWFALGFNAGIINLFIMYLDNTIVTRKERNDDFRTCLSFGAVSFVVLLVYLFIKLINRSIK